MNPPSEATVNRPRKAWTLILRAGYYLFLMAGILVLVYTAYTIADAHAYQAVEKAKFENVKGSKRDAPPQVVQGDVIGELEVPRLGLQTIVVQGDSAQILRRAVGHIVETALPGQQGNVTLAGHRDSFFRPLRNIRPGDTITLKTLDGDFQYQVEFTVVVPPSDMEVLQPSGERTLTLITCFPFYYVGSAPNRFVVRARATD
ncbi:MAG: class D sortase [Candidatus Acidiferrales bacterium]|jgi:sortase A